MSTKREEKTEEGWFELVRFGPKQEEESRLSLLAEKHTSWAAIHDGKRVGQHGLNPY